MYKAYNIIDSPALNVLEFSLEMNFTVQKNSWGCKRKSLLVQDIVSTSYLCIYVV